MCINFIHLLIGSEVCFKQPFMYNALTLFKLDRIWHDTLCFFHGCLVGGWGSNLFFSYCLLLQSFRKLCCSVECQGAGRPFSFCNVEVERLFLIAETKEQQNSLYSCEVLKRFMLIECYYMHLEFPIWMVFMFMKV